MTAICPAPVRDASQTFYYTVINGDTVSVSFIENTGTGYHYSLYAKHMQQGSVSRKTVVPAMPGNPTLVTYLFKATIPLNSYGQIAVHYIPPGQQKHTIYVYNFQPLLA